MKEAIIISKNEIYKMVENCAETHKELEKTKKEDSEECSEKNCPMFGYCLQYYTGDDSCLPVD